MRTFAAQFLRDIVSHRYNNEKKLSILLEYEVVIRSG
jgi:hypothetical protein